MTLLKISIRLLALIASSVSGAEYKFSEDCYDSTRGIVVFEERVDKKLYLSLSDLRNNANKQIEIDDKSSTPIICGGTVVVCSYGAKKVCVYDYELRLLYKIDMAPGVVPFYSTSNSDGTFLYVYVVRFNDDREPSAKCVYRYRQENGRLNYSGEAPVAVVGKIISYENSVFVVNDRTCERITFQTEQMKSSPSPGH